jgi:hypothetical protein
MIKSITDGTDKEYFSGADSHNWQPRTNTGLASFFLEASKIKADRFIGQHIGQVISISQSHRSQYHRYKRFGLQSWFTDVWEVS